MAIIFSCQTIRQASQPTEESLMPIVSRLDAEIVVHWKH